MEVGRVWLLVLMLILATAAKKPDPVREAVATFDQKAFLENIRTLASDEFEGRSPGTRGEELTIKFLAKKFAEVGASAGNPDGTYFQKVPLVGYTIDTGASLKLIGSRGELSLKFADDYVAWTRRLVEEVQMQGEVVFVGYGVQAPEYGWDDYKGLDVKGKVLLMLINDPQVPDERLFGGKAMTYYGRWTYKYEIAAKLGAAGAIIIHETGPAGYGWNVVRNGREREQFTIDSGNKNLGLCPVEGWITYEKAEALFKLAGKDLAEAKRAALERNFRPLALEVKAELLLKNKLRYVDSHNVIAKVEGSDPKLRNEYVIYVAHWDHFGIGGSGADRIYNGAVDNATGTAALLELAKAFSKARPKRSVLFLAVTAEERGLLGSAYYAEHPLYPHNKTLAVINIDSMNVYGRTKDVVVIGLGASSLDDYVRAAARLQDRVVKPDPEPEKGYYYRSDHFSFAKHGVPAVYAESGIDYVDKPKGYGMQVRERYVSQDYHQPSDEVREDWDLSGAMQDIELLFRVGYEVANAKRMPTWRPKSEFRAIREASLRGK
ncbi:MAG: M28 family metallopeptidase [Acidobacteriota bacterium]|nr:M28 family metallopeptidase [Blastocatellia bacterium]MDW8411237.1 M28 family metallopeptidase [Acidobacteriota bacterium]